MSSVTAPVMDLARRVLHSAPCAGVDTVGLSKMHYILLSIKLGGQGSKALLKPVSKAHNPLSITSA